LALLFEHQKNWDSLLYHQRQWAVLKELYEAQSRKKLTMQIEAEYAVNQQEKELLQLRQEAQLEEERNRRKDIIQWAICCGLLLLLFAALWIIYLKRKHNKELKKHLKKIKLQHEEKEMLLQEIHHRVKNNLQVVTSLLNVQSQSITDPTTKALFDQSQYRINSMAMIHKMLYQSNDLSAINYKTYLEQLVKELLHSVKGEDTKVQLDINIAPVQLNMDTAIPLGLIINELVTNALKYGLPKEQESVLKVHLKTIYENSYLLEISDNGAGMVQDWTKVSAPSSSSLGLRLVRKLSRQLKGELQLVPTSTGTHYRLYFKEITALS
jgi:two-component sensor histidine kinase